MSESRVKSTEIRVTPQSSNGFVRFFTFNANPFASEDLDDDDSTYR